MVRMIPLMLLALAACDPPLEELHPRQNYTFVHNDVAYDVRVQYDPLEFAFFARVSRFSERIEYQDRNAVFHVVEKQLGPQICQGRYLSVFGEEVWTGFGGHRMRYLPELGEWQLAGECSGQQAIIRQGQENLEAITAPRREEE